MLTGEYLKRAKANKLPREANILVKQCYAFLRQLDVVMAEPSTFERGKLVAELASSLEMAVDSFYLYGIKPPRKTKQRSGGQFETVNG